MQSRGEYLAGAEHPERGCRDPLTGWKGRSVVLDGHTRRELCIKVNSAAAVTE